MEGLSSGSPVSVLPAPRKMSVGNDVYLLPPDAGVRGPAEVVSLARQLLGLAGTGPGVDLELVDDAQLGSEGYRLAVSRDGVRASAVTVDGLRWAVQTLRQLLTDGALPHLTIVDRPQHAWRGCLLDVARWYHPLPFLYRFVDLLATYKLNTLHLHLTDDQGWRFEVHRYPRLTEVGGFRAGSSSGHLREGRVDATPHGGFYRQSELAGLVAYAAERGVRIMPEIDAPGHMQAAVAAYPELGNLPERQLSVRRQWGISPHVLNTADATLAFLGHVLDELVEVFPFEYVHVGGDEVPVTEWANSPAALRRVAAEGLPGPGHLHSWWTGRLATHLKRHGRRAGAWDDVLDSETSTDVTVFAWRDAGRVAQAMRAGHQVVAAPSEYTYFDFAEADDDRYPAIGAGLPLEKVYGYRPPDGVLGVQSQLWTEYMPTTPIIEWRALPRLTAISEVGWCSAERDLDDFRRRVADHSSWWDRLGLSYRPR
jgi:hexosaminidase